MESRIVHDGRGPDDVDAFVDRRRAPVDLVAMTVFERSARARQPDDVGQAGGKGEQRAPVAPDEQRYPFLHRAGRRHDGVVEIEVLPVVGDHLSLQQGGDDVDHLRQAPDPLRGRRIGASRHGPFARRMTRAETEDSAAVRQPVERCGRARPSADGS